MVYSAGSLSELDISQGEENDLQSNDTASNHDTTASTSSQSQKESYGGDDYIDNSALVKMKMEFVDSQSNDSINGKFKNKVYICKEILGMFWDVGQR